jgi:hypothetical protein
MPKGRQSGKLTLRISSRLWQRLKEGGKAYGY